MKNLLHISVFMGILGLGVSLPTAHTLATEAPHLDSVERRVNNNIDDATVTNSEGIGFPPPFEIEGEAVEVEILGSPREAPNQYIFEPTFERDYDGMDIQVVEFSVPFE
ncbi:MAG: hypothetical protein AAGH78_16710 [Cyanobacteria bacterium P01_H01_bin.58]